MATEHQTENLQSVGSHALLAATATYAIIPGFGLIAFGLTPAAAETGAQVVTWFQEHRDSVRWGVWAWTVGIPAFAIMVALLRRLLPAPHRDIFLVGAVAYATMIAIYTWTFAGLALHADLLEPRTARTVFDVAIFMGPVLTGTTTTMMAPVTLLALRSQAGLPRWLGTLGLIALVEQAIETVTIFGSTGFTQPGGAMNLQLGAGLTFAWILAFGMWGGFRGRYEIPAPELAAF